MLSVKYKPAVNRGRDSLCARSVVPASRTWFFCDVAGMSRVWNSVITSTERSTELSRRLTLITSLLAAEIPSSWFWVLSTLLTEVFLQRVECGGSDGRYIELISKYYSADSAGIWLLEVRVLIFDPSRPRPASPFLGQTTWNQWWTIGDKLVGMSSG